MKKRTRIKYRISHKKHSIFILVVFVLFLGMGYSLLSTNLKINGSSKVDSSSYLAGNYFTSNDAEDGSVWVVKDGFVSTASKNTNIGVRPVINVRYSSLKGDGTINNPYMIEE